MVTRRATRSQKHSERMNEANNRLVRPRDRAPHSRDVVQKIEIGIAIAIERIWPQDTKSPTFTGIKRTPTSLNYVYCLITINYKTG